MKNLVISLNIIPLPLLGYLFYLGGPKGIQEYMIVFCLLVTPLVTLYYFYLSKPEGESLISLWLSVRKKKLKDELEDND